MDQTKLSDMKAISFRFDEEYSPHSMYIKEYLPKNYDEEKPLGRTLFVSRVPLYVDESDIKKLFSEVGEVLTVTLQKGNADMEYYIAGFQCAYVVYKTRENLVKALNMEKFKTLSDDKYTPLRGLQKYIKEYNNSIRSHADLLEDATKAIQLYDKQEEERKLNEKNKTDDDGWTVVTSKGRKINAELAEKLNNQRKKKELKNFYTFQIKESKKKNLEMLREGYEEAKRKVANMKKNRSFKPY